MATASIKSNFHSVSCGRLIASIKQHFTTCCKRWREKHIASSNTHQYMGNLTQTTAQHKIVQNCDLIKPSCTIASNSEVVKLLPSCGKAYGRKIQIIAKLLSVSLVARKDCTTTDNMTVMDLNFISIREEHPSLDAEIRGILLSRAQHGATITEIKNDYYKLTGNKFPVYDNITEFLLTVPYVMVHCDDSGVRIFNIMPKDKTKHLLELVLKQNPIPQEKQQQQQKQREHEQQQQDYYHINPTYCNNNNNNINNLQRHYFYKDKCERNNQCRRFHKQPNNMIRVKHQQQQQPHSHIIYSDAKILQRNNKAVCCNECYVDESQCGTDGAYTESNWCYQDNCNYLYNRYCSQHNLPPSQANSYCSNKMAPHIPNVIPPTNTDFHSSHRMINNLNDPYNRLTKVNDQQFRPSIGHTPLTGSEYRYGLSSSPTKSFHTMDSLFTDNDFEAHLFDFLLLGDDFLLYMARMELGCKFKKDERVLQSGLCVSGQNISAAIKRVNQYNIGGRSVIINIGSVDIMQGRHFIEIQHDFRQLIATLLKMDVKPILTTLAPLANYAHQKDFKNMLLRFNEYIRREGEARQLLVIDIWSCLVNAKGYTLFDCYQNGPRNVTGATESYVFWNKIGRQRVLRLIESQLEY